MSKIEKSAKRARMVLVDADIVSQMNGNLRAQTFNCVQQAFGISFNTWTKLKKGKPIRASLADRLLQAHKKSGS